MTATNEKAMAAVVLSLFDKVETLLGFEPIR
jgi:hypothetical protein